MGADADGAKGSPGKKDDEEEDGGDGDEGRAKKKRKLGEDADVSASDETGARVRVRACVRVTSRACVRIHDFVTAGKGCGWDGYVRSRCGVCLSVCFLWLAR